MMITVNGEARDIVGGGTVQTLLDELGLDCKAVVVQRNDEIVERVDYGTTALSEGDVLDLVRFVGGG